MAVKNLILINLSENASLLEELRRYNQGFFGLRTCCRTLIISLDSQILDIFNNSFFFREQFRMYSGQVYRGVEGYIYLLEVISGLHSKLIGENEIVSQFKKAYQIYTKTNYRDLKVLKILEKVFKDNKDIRFNYLNSIKHKTYASLVKNIILSRKNVKSVLIFGSGDLARDLINQFQKRLNVFISARNSEVLSNLKKKFLFNIINWKDYCSYLNFPHIVNTIGANEVIFNNDFFYDWLFYTDQNRLFVDLGVPSVIKVPKAICSCVISLPAILREGEELKKSKLIKIDNARKFIRCLAKKKLELEL